MSDFATLLFSSSEDLTTTAAHLEARLGSTFRPRTSTYRGGGYLYAGDYTRPGAEMIIVQHNNDNGQAAESCAADACTLVVVEATTRPEEVVHLLGTTPLKLIRQTPWPRR